jgi:uncharacterized protein
MPRPEDSVWAVPVASVSSRAGQQKHIDTIFPAPSGVGDDIVGITQGSDIHVLGSFDSIIDGLVFSGRFNAPLHAECTRCLTTINRDWTMDVTAFFPYEADKANTSIANQDSEAQDDEAEDAYPLSPDGGFADMEALLRDTLVEHLPLQLLCKDDCKGLCSQCGINLNEHPEHHHDVTDMRFAALADFKEQLEHND